MKRITVLVLFGFLLTACATKVASTPTPILSPNQTYSPTRTTTETPTITPEPTPTPTEAVPITIPEQGIPNNLVEINAGNVDQLKPIALYGPGTYYHDYFWSPSQKLFTVSRDSGFEVFDLTTTKSTLQVGTYGKCTILGFASEDIILVKIQKISGTFLSIYSINARKFINSLGYSNIPGRPAEISGIDQVLISNDYQLAANDENSKVSIWDLSTGKMTLMVDTGINSWLYWLSQSGNKFATVDEDLKTIKLWSSKDGSMLSKFTTDQVYLTEDLQKPQLALHIIWDGELLEGEKTNNYNYWALDTGSLQSSIDIGSSYISFGYSPDEKLLGTVENGGTFQFWNISNGTVFSKFGTNEVYDQYAFSVDGSKLIAQIKGKFGVWKIGDGTQVVKNGVTSLFYLQTPDGKYLIPYCEVSHQGITIVNMLTGVSRFIDSTLRDTSRCAISPNGNYIAEFSTNPWANNVQTSGPMLRIRDIESGNELTRIFPPKDWIGRIYLAFSPDGSEIAVSSYKDGFHPFIGQLCSGVAFWDMSGKLVKNICFEDPIYDGILFSTDSKNLLLYHSFRWLNVDIVGNDKVQINMENGIKDLNTNGTNWTASLSDRGSALSINLLSAGDYSLTSEGQDRSKSSWKLKDNQGSEIYDTKSSWLPAFSKDGSLVFFALGSNRNAVLNVLRTQDLDVKEIQPLTEFDWYRNFDDSDLSIGIWWGGNQIVMSPDGKTLATITRGTVTLWGVQR